MSRKLHIPLAALLLAAAGQATAQTTPPLAPAANSAAAAATAASRFELEGAVIDTRSGNSLGVVNERGDLAALFRAQKAMTFGILRAAGISLDQLSPEVRARIERFQTTNVEAFRAFSQGLDLKDQGRFTEAREQFRRAAELDPGFALAAEQQQAMPDVNLGTGVQTRAVLQAVAGAAVERGKNAYVVDVSRAQAALSAGQQVVVVNAPQEAARAGYSVNEEAGRGRFSSNAVVALAYSFTNVAGQTISLTNPNEWRTGEVVAAGGVLDAVGSVASGFSAQRLGASTTDTGQLAMADGTVAYWGRWASSPGSSASVTVSGTPVRAPVLGAVDYLYADAPRVMPGSGTVVFTPAGGRMADVTGSIAVDFLQRSVNLQNLGFRIDSLVFSNLNGSSTYDAGIASGAFNGRYTSGSCAGCTGFSPTASVYSGNFVGTNANGLVFSTFLLTGGSGTAAGVHLFTRPGP